MRRDGKSFGRYRETRTGTVWRDCIHRYFDDYGHHYGGVGADRCESLVHSPWVRSPSQQLCRSLCLWVSTRVISVRAKWRDFIVGFILLMLAVIYGEDVPIAPLVHWFDLDGIQLT